MTSSRKFTCVNDTIVQVISCGHGTQTIKVYTETLIGNNIHMYLLAMGKRCSKNLHYKHSHEKYAEK